MPATVNMQMNKNRLYNHNHTNHRNLKDVQNFEEAFERSSFSQRIPFQPTHTVPEKEYESVHESIKNQPWPKHFANRLYEVISAWKWRKTIPDFDGDDEEGLWRGSFDREDEPDIPDIDKIKIKTRPTDDEDEEGLWRGSSDSEDEPNIDKIKIKTRPTKRVRFQ